jgi:hypothetical protein
VMDKFPDELTLEDELPEKYGTVVWLDEKAWLER